MLKIILSFIIIFSFSMGSSVLIIKDGWQLVGSSVAISDMSLFGVDDVSQVWHFDASTQKWRGYSPDKEIEAKMRAKGIDTLSSLESWHGFWVKSKRDWALVLDSPSSDSIDTNISKGDIPLKKGWNLISMPIDSVLSPDIFGDMVVWRYDRSNKWEFYDKNQTEYSFPRLNHIKNSDGLWVKSPKDQNISVIDEASKLHNFDSIDEMESFIKDMVTINNRPYWGIMPMVDMMMDDGMVMEGVATNEAIYPISAPDTTTDTGYGASDSKDATTTNLQESGVDESDILKHNNRDIFYKLSYNSIGITSFDALAKNETKALDTITLGDDRYIDSFYLVGDNLVVVSALNSYNTSKDIYTQESMPYYGGYSNQTVIDIVDVSDISAIKTTSTLKIDGSMIDSRVIGDSLYLISSFSPQVDITYPKVYIDKPDNCSGNKYNYIECYGINMDYQSSRYYRYDYDNPTIDIVQLTPNITQNSNPKEPLLTPNRLYASSKQNQESSITTISNISISKGAYVQSNSFVGYTNIQYASTNSLYLVSNKYPLYYDFNNYKERLNIYKFGLDEELSYRGKGEVMGHAINQFALSEYNDTLRIATTEGFSWGSEGTNNTLYTLKEQNGILPIQGVLSGLGKEFETIKSVRFVKDRGYIVTFQQTDPLYTIDLSDPTNPQKIGELHIDGYSDYLHPVGDDIIIGFGRDADASGRTKGVKIELVDVSDFASPVSLDSIILNDNTSSQLEYNHKALAYRYSDNLFAFAYTDYTNYTTQNFLGIYQLKDSQLISYTPLETTESSWGEKRGLIFDINGTTYISFLGNQNIITTTLKDR